MSNPITVAPTGFHVMSVACGDYVNLAWNTLTPPAGEGPVTSYTIAWGATSGSQAYKYTVGPDETAVTIGGVGGGTAGKHYFELWANPAPAGNSLALESDVIM